MPKFFNEEGREALQLAKGFSTPTRDNVATALGAWALMVVTSSAYHTLIAPSNAALPCGAQVMMREMPSVATVTDVTGPVCPS